MKLIPHSHSCPADASTWDCNNSYCADPEWIHCGGSNCHSPYPPDERRYPVWHLSEALRISAHSLWDAMNTLKLADREVMRQDVSVIRDELLADMEALQDAVKREAGR